MASTSVLENKRKVVEEPVKEQGMWIFADTKCKVDKKVTFTWNSLFQAFQDKDFKMLLQDYVSTELSKEVYKKYLQVQITQSSYQDSGTTMSGCYRMDHKED